MTSLKIAIYFSLILLPHTNSEGEIKKEKVQESNNITTTQPATPVPSYLRIKRLCGIPDGTDWSYKTKCIYHERILFVIDSLEKEVKKKRFIKKQTQWK